MVSVLVINENNGIKFNTKDVTIQTKRGSGPGGQHRNKTESMVVLTHKPTKIAVSIDGRDQHANKKLAFAILNTRIEELNHNVSHRDMNQAKLAQVGYGHRSNKIRTYNFIENRATDHRSNKKCSLEKVMRGNFFLLDNNKK